MTVLASEKRRDATPCDFERSAAGNQEQRIHKDNLGDRQMVPVIGGRLTHHQRTRESGERHGDGRQPNPDAGSDRLRRRIVDGFTGLVHRAQV